MGVPLTIEALPAQDLPYGFQAVYLPETDVGFVESTDGTLLVVIEFVEPETPANGTKLARLSSKEVN